MERKQEGGALELGTTFTFARYREDILLLKLWKYNNLIFLNFNIQSWNIYVVWAHFFWGNFCNSTSLNSPI